MKTALASLCAFLLYGPVSAQEPPPNTTEECFLCSNVEQIDSVDTSNSLLLPNDCNLSGGFLRLSDSLENAIETIYKKHWPEQQWREKEPLSCNSAILAYRVYVAVKAMEVLSK